MKAISKEFALLLILAVGFIIYSNSLNTGFHYDDRYYIEKNEAIRDATDIKAMWDYRKHRIITILTFALNYHFGKLQAFGYHLVNIFIHIYSSISVYFLARLTFETPRMKESPLRKHADVMALLSGLIFLCHPIQVQAVTYISQRLASLCALFYISALVLYVKARLSHKFFYYLIALLPAIAAMFTKENAITLPLIILLYELVFFGAQKRNTKKIFLYLIPAALVAVITVGVLYNSMPKFAQRDDTFLQKLHFVPRLARTVPHKDYFLTQLNVLRTYMRLLIFPVNQNLDYDYPISHSIVEFDTMLSLSLLTIAVIFAVRTFRKSPLISFGIFWFLITLLPESSIFPLPDVIEEHRLYLPMAGFALFILPVMALIANKRKMLVILSSVLVLILSFLAYNRNKIWKDALTLWQDTVRKSPNKFRPHNALGFIYYNMARYDDAISEYLKAAAIDPQGPNIYHNLGAVYARKGNYDKAIEYCQKSIRVDPGVADVYYVLGASYASSHDIDGAVKQVSVLRNLGQDELAGKLERIIRIKGKIPRSN